MNASALLIEVRFVEGRYHGRNDWPPSPFRLFQALVAGSYGGRWVSEPENDKDAAFSWLEGLDPPHIAAPPREKGASASYFVPNNDLDAVGGDPLRIQRNPRQEDSSGEPFLSSHPCPLRVAIR